MVAFSRTQLARCTAVAVSATALTVMLVGCTGSSGSGSSAHSSGSASPTSTSASTGTASASSPSTTLSPATKTVKPPVPGSVRQTVATHSPSVLPAAPLTKTVRLAAGVTVRIVSTKAIEAVSHVPGEVNGPAIEVTVFITNTSSSKTLNVNSAEVTLTDSHGGPGTSVTTSASRTFSGTVKPGAHATGIYDFRVAVSRRDPVTVTASYTGAGPVATFVGAVK